MVDEASQVGVAMLIRDLGRQHEQVELAPLLACAETTQLQSELLGLSEKG